MKENYWENKYEELAKAIRQGIDIVFCKRCDGWYDFYLGRACDCCDICADDWDGDIGGNICRSCLEEMKASPPTMSDWERNA